MKTNEKYYATMMQMGEVNKENLTEACKYAMQRPNLDYVCIFSFEDEAAIEKISNVICSELGTAMHDELSKSKNKIGIVFDMVLTSGMNIVFQSRYMENKLEQYDVIVVPIVMNGSTADCEFAAGILPDKITINDIQKLSSKLGVDKDKLVGYDFVGRYIAEAENDEIHVRRSSAMPSMNRYSDEIYEYVDIEEWLM